MDLYAITVSPSQKKNDGRGLLLKMLGNDHEFEFRAKSIPEC